MAEVSNSLPEFAPPVKLEQTISPNWINANVTNTGGVGASLVVTSPWIVRPSHPSRGKNSIESYLMHIYAVQSTITSRREIQSTEQRAWSAISLLSLAVGIIAGCAFAGSSWITPTTGILACLFVLSLIPHSYCVGPRATHKARSCLD